ncbi:MAG TPA: hypothetical protein VMW52_09605 [Phycisphaerae bacterium]|nr:hypothetical protein [Phycisphaerae bacterium]
MADTKNGTRWMVWVWTGLLVLVVGLLVSQMVALGATNERVARLEAQYEYVVKSLDRIERAVNAGPRGEGGGR